MTIEGLRDSGLVREAYRSAGPARSRFIGSILNMIEPERPQPQMQRLGPALRPKTVS